MTIFLGDVALTLSVSCVQNFPQKIEALLQRLRDRSLIMGRGGRVYKTIGASEVLSLQKGGVAGGGGRTILPMLKVGCLIGPSSSRLKGKLAHNFSENILYVKLLHYDL